MWPIGPISSASLACLCDNIRNGAKPTQVTVTPPHIPNNRSALDIQWGAVMAHMRSSSGGTVARTYRVGSWRNTRQFLLNSGIVDIGAGGGIRTPNPVMGSSF